MNPVNNARRNAIIFKADDESNSPSDPYVTELEKLSIDSRIIPALKFEFYNLENLKDRLSSPDDFSGIIFNSPRCFLAAEKCGSLSKWTNHKTFCVGTKTGSLVRNLGIEPLGEDCGNAAALADFILREYSYLELPLLLPHGNLSLKTVSNSLTSGGMKVNCVEIYRTIPNPGLDSLLSEYFEKYSKVDFVIYMSPSAIDASFSLLERFQELPSIKFVSLGPTTAQCLEGSGITPDGVAGKPTPHHLANTISKIISTNPKS